MTNSEKFINWLEGYLDASKNNLTANQIKEIRKKITEYNKNTATETVPLWDSANAYTYSYVDGNTKPYTKTYSTPVNEDYLREIEKNKNASTMEELI